MGGAAVIAEKESMEGVHVEDTSGNRMGAGAEGHVTAEHAAALAPRVEPGVGVVGGMEVAIEAGEEADDDAHAVEHQT